MFCMMSTVKSILIVSLNTFLSNGDILVYDVRVKLPIILSFLVFAFMPTCVQMVIVAPDHSQ